MDKLNAAIALLKRKCGVIPKEYTMYNGAFLFIAYPPNVQNEKQQLSPYYLVDLQRKTAGPFSPAFDFEGFFKAAEKFKSI